ncbi:hypothetical protein BDV3_001912 [Batrachochytrium dendrobatidis]|nr:hypothetical protein O5D80_007423 [Batrachochytrium dendrobatidis]KAK5665020.1 hypothetical protein QVD99_008554 [Batrachochytrium dendrobatidis]OAJ43400.1 hypothetical protein BDEG_26763 [Batrachochytrium dendrobatidis JEL423]
MAYQQQYPSQPGMQMYGAPQMKKESFTHGLFDCFGDFGTCILSCCCPCVTYGQNLQRAEGKDGCCMDATFYLFTMFCGLHSCCGCYGRGRVRHATNITEGSVGDCCAHLFCAPCALTQEKRELDSCGR